MAYSTDAPVLVDGVFQGFAWLELGDLSGFDLDGLACLRIASGTGRAIGDLEGPESDERHRLLLFQAGSDGVQGSIDCAGGRGLGEVGGFRDGLDEILFVHKRPLSLLPVSNPKCNVWMCLYSNPSGFGQGAMSG